jgi:pyruvate dehydrogenase E2 component (dihydrolipoamide acetyltransferase)
MNVPVVMPQLGLTMTEGSVSEWLKKPGELVHKGEMLFVVSTDKADMEVESLDEGTLVQIVVEPGLVVPVGTVIAYLGGSEDMATSPPAPLQATATPPPKVDKMSAMVSTQQPPLAPISALSTMEGPPASPRARKVARELGIDISQVTLNAGSDRIVEKDVRRFAETIRPQVAKITPPDLRRRHLIAERLTKSIQTIPHFSVSAQVRADQLISLHESLKGPVEKQASLKITVTDLLLKALGLALEETAGMMTVWEEGNCQTVAAIDLGLAIASDRGVVAPVIRNVGGLDLVEIARWRLAVTEKERGGRLSLSDLDGGIGTLSNLGTFRVNQFQAIISPGQSFILAVGKIAQRPWVEGGALIVARTVTLTLSVDHRVADGALAAQFLEKIAEIIENPYRLLWGRPKSKSSK